MIKKESDSCKPRGYEWFVAENKHREFFALKMLNAVEWMMKAGDRFEKFTRDIGREI